MTSTGQLGTANKQVASGGGTLELKLASEITSTSATPTIKGAVYYNPPSYVSGNRGVTFTVLLDLPAGGDGYVQLYDVNGITNNAVPRIIPTSIQHTTASPGLISVEITELETATLPGALYFQVYTNASLNPVQIHEAKLNVTATNISTAAPQSGIIELTLATNVIATQQVAATAGGIYFNAPAYAVGNRSVTFYATVEMPSGGDGYVQLFDPNGITNSGGLTSMNVCNLTSGDTNPTEGYPHFATETFASKNVNPANYWYIIAGIWFEVASSAITGARSGICILDGAGYKLTYSLQASGSDYFVPIIETWNASNSRTGYQTYGRVPFNSKVWLYLSNNTGPLNAYFGATGYQWHPFGSDSRSNITIPASSFPITTYFPNNPTKFGFTCNNNGAAANVLRQTFFSLNLLQI